LLVTRAVYSTLDYLADIGGLFGTFNGFATTISLILNFNGVYHLLTSSMFKAKTNITKKNKGGEDADPGKSHALNRLQSVL